MPVAAAAARLLKRAYRLHLMKLRVALFVLLIQSAAARKHPSHQLIGRIEKRVDGGKKRVGQHFRAVDANSGLRGASASYKTLV